MIAYAVKLQKDMKYRKSSPYDLYCIYIKFSKAKW